MKLSLLFKKKIILVGFVLSTVFISLPLVASAATLSAVVPVSSCTGSGSETSGGAPACSCQTNMIMSTPAHTQVYPLGEMCLMANNIGFFADFQKDGNFVVYQIHSVPAAFYKVAIWNSETSNKSAISFDALSNGNFGIFKTVAGKQIVLWQSHTSGHPGDRMVMDNSGQLTIYEHDNNVPIWRD
jgi:hypothetical protein